MTTPHASPACIGLGSNLGDRAAHLDAALAMLARLPGTALYAVSRRIETPPVAPLGIEAGGPYLNAAALLHTSLPPRDLLRHLLAIEAARGRDRVNVPRFGPRTLDLDLLLYADAVIDEPGLHLPHPRLADRLFVLEPLAEIAGAMPVPGVGGGRSVADLLQALRSRSIVGRASRQGSAP
ncbi:MAG: 2-amino-4-hydroxy-6-hydroxymethyldihydropteridine diphosphokinase [Phycisphaeraceae bacterium]|nr:2-amino-4-hydroxy-6-hydroxymethyldihydropteridine diphosphokinase [Phycisphaeraceae bacterium]